MHTETGRLYTPRSHYTTPSHQVLTLVFNEQIVNYYSGFKAKMQAKAQESGIQAS